MLHLKVPHALFFFIISLSSYCQDSIAIEPAEENVLFIRKSKENKNSVFHFLKPDNIGIQIGPSLGFEKNKQGYYSADNSPFYIDRLDYDKIVLYNQSSGSSTDTVWGAGANYTTPTSRLSVSVGVKAEYRLGKVISLNPEVSCLGTGSSVTTSKIYFPHINYDYQGYINYKENHNYTYLDFIVPIKFTPTWLRFHPYVAIGPEIGILLSAKRQVKILELGGPAGVKDSMVKYGLPISSFTERISIPPIQAGLHLRFGLGYYLSKMWELQFEIRDFVGYSNTYHYPSTNIRNNIYSFTAGISYHFNSPYIKRIKRSARFNRNTGLKIPEPFLPQSFHFLGFQLTVGAVSTAHTQLSSLNKSTGPTLSLSINYIKSLNQNWLVEPYFQASFLSYTFNESYYKDSNSFYPSGNWGYSFGGLSVGNDFIRYKNGRSKFKPFYGAGLNIMQILQLYVSPNENSPNTGNVGRYENFNFYRIPTPSLKIFVGTFYRFHNSHYLKINLYVNHSFYPTTLFTYSYYNKSHSLYESASAKTWNFGYGISIAYTFFNLKKLKKEFQNEIKQ